MAWLHPSKPQFFEIGKHNFINQKNKQKPRYTGQIQKHSLSMLAEQASVGREPKVIWASGYSLVNWVYPNAKL